MTQQLATISEGETVSVLMSRNIKPGCEEKFWALDQQIQRAIKDVPGFLSVNHFPTTTRNATDKEELAIITIAQFDNIDSLMHWEESPMRAQLFEQQAELVIGDSRRRSITGLEGMFAPSQDLQPTPPKRHKMALMIVVVIFGQLVLLRPVINYLLPQVPELLRSLILVVIQVTAMSYFIMPRLTRLLSKWLYR
jgi:antibiotic biosynthesis monooxygenase (ABM) superfamily enzyme